MAPMLQLLRTAGIETTVYNVEPGRMLVTLQQGWRGYEVRKFLEEQAVVTEIEWDQVRYTPRSVNDDDDREDDIDRDSAGRKAAGAAGSKQKRRQPRRAAGKRGRKSGKPRKARQGSGQQDLKGDAEARRDEL